MSYTLSPELQKEWDRIYSEEFKKAWNAMPYKTELNKAISIDFQEITKSTQLRFMIEVLVPRAIKFGIRKARSPLTTTDKDPINEFIEQNFNYGTPNNSK